MKRLILFLSFSVIFFTKSFGQFQQPDITAPSPNAVNLGTYGLVPVSNFTGISQVSIPIFDLKQDEITVPVSLSYYASGVKPDQHPGWVGLNWNLNGYGAITRQVKDLPDEMDMPNTDVKRLPYVFFSVMGYNGVKGGRAGYYFNYSENKFDDWSSSVKIKSIVDNVRDAKDTEPDEFAFNFLGYSGKFYLDENRQWQVKSDSPIKVIFESNNFLDLPDNLIARWSSSHTDDQYPEIFSLRGGDNPKSFGGFTLISEDGTKYIFGSNQTDKSTNAIEYSIPFFDQATQNWWANSWYLTKIQLISGKEINFTYQPDDFISNMYVSFMWYLSIPMKDANTAECSTYSDRHYGFGNNEEDADWINPKYGSYSGDLIRPVYLSAIKTNTIEISFIRELSNELRYPSGAILKNKSLSELFYRQLSQRTYLDGAPSWVYLYKGNEAAIDATFGDAKYNIMIDAMKWKKLTSIEIKDRTSSQSQKGIKYVLKYNDVSTERLMLQTVTKKSLDGSVVIPPYKLQYYNDVTLPPYLVESFDHWGFFNANTTQCFTQPRTAEIAENGNLNLYLDKIPTVRAPASSVSIAQSGSLKRITYPTGGYSELTYEQNTYANIVNKDRKSLTPVSSNPKAGGLRIRKITNVSSDPQYPSIDKEYFYVAGYYSGYDPNTNGLPSSGILGGTAEYFFNSETTNTGNSNVLKVVNQVLSSQNILPFSFNNTGIHVGYSEVTEKISDGSFTVYKYTNYETAEGKHYDEIVFPGSFNDINLNVPLSDKSHERGRLRSKEIYSSAGKILQKQNFKYTILPQDPIRSLFVYANSFPCFETVFTGYHGVPYYNYVYKYVPLLEEDYVYDQLDNTKFNYSSRQFNSYTPLGQLKELAEAHDDVQYVTTFKRPSDNNYIYLPTQDNIAGKVMLISQNVSSVIEQYTVKKDANGFNKIISANAQTYKPDPSNTAIVVSDTKYDLEITDPLDVTLYAYQSNYKPKNTFEHDAQGNISFVKDSEGNSASYIWDVYASNPIAKVVNSTSANIYHTSFEDTDGTADGNSKTGQNIRTSAFNKTLSYLSNGNYVISYWQRVNGTWTPIKNSVTVSSTSYAISLPATTSQPIDEVRFCPELSQMTTYTYDNLFGLTSKTDSNNITEYYEYDSFGRLSVIKDFNKNIVRVLEYNYQLK
jgi:YD repeat-containing protein